MDRRELVVHNDTKIIHDIYFLLQLLVILIDRRRKGIRMTTSEKIRFLRSLTEYFINQKGIQYQINDTRKSANMITY